MVLYVNKGIIVQIIYACALAGDTEASFKRLFVKLQLRSVFFGEGVNVTNTVALKIKQYGSVLIYIKAVYNSLHKVGLESISLRSLLRSSLSATAGLISRFWQSL